MVKSCDDIQNYLTIVENDINNTENMNEEIDTRSNELLGKVYLFENGTRWALINEVDGEDLKIEHGFIEYEADSSGYITIYEMTCMIKDGEMILLEEAGDSNDFLMEKTGHNNDFNDFIKKADRYLLVNEDKDSTEFEYSWQDAWTEDKSPIEAAEEAIILEG